MQATASATATASLTVTIHGANDAPVAVADTGDATEAGGVNNSTAVPEATGIRLANVTGVQTCAHAVTKAVSAVNGVGANVGSSVTGAHGSVTINNDRSEERRVGKECTAGQAPRLSTQTLTDSFT